MEEGDRGKKGEVCKNAGPEGWRTERMDFRRPGRIAKTILLARNDLIPWKGKGWGGSFEKTGKKGGWIEE